MNSRHATAEHRASSLLPGLFFIAGWVVLLEIAARNGWINRAFSPVPTEIAGHLRGVVTSSAFPDALASTIGLLAVGYLLACAVGVLLGIAMGYDRRIYVLLEPALELLRPIPKPALLPPLILLFGLGASMKISIVFLGAVFPVLINTVQGVRSIDPVVIDVARTFRCGVVKILFKVVLPASLPMILSGMRVSLGLGLVLVILAEMLTGSQGLGAQLVDAQRSFRVHEMYAWTVVLAMLGLVLALAFDAVERSLIFWSSKR
jgi:ABC-type nitrate/sulfonate/bicarbonate transport system permease component